jgi:hypothetical protein
MRPSLLWQAWLAHSQDEAVGCAWNRSLGSQGQTQQSRRAPQRCHRKRRRPAAGEQSVPLPALRGQRELLQPQQRLRPTAHRSLLLRA